MFWLPLLLSSLVIADATEQCNYKSTYTVMGRYLKDHVISSENVKNIGMCYVRCLRHQRCKSINFHFGDLLCELNDANRHTHPWDYVLRKDFTYSDYPVKVPFKEYVMTPAWLVAHSSYIDNNRSTTADQITFNAGSITDAALLKVPLVAAGVLKDEAPLTIEITVANDVSIGEKTDSDIRYGVSDGINFIGFETVDKWNLQHHQRYSPCYMLEAVSGSALSDITWFKKFADLPAAITSFYPYQFDFTLKLDQPWGSCLTAHGEGYTNSAEYSKRLLVSQGLTLEVYKGHKWETVGIKYINVTIMKTDD